MRLAALYHMGGKGKEHLSALGLQLGRGTGFEPATFRLGMSKRRHF